MREFNGFGERVPDLGSLVILSVIRCITRPEVGRLEAQILGCTEKHRVVTYDWHPKRNRTIETVIATYDSLPAAQAFVQCWELAGRSDKAECLACELSFQSEGPHNRVCTSCAFECADNLPPDLAGGIVCR